MVYDYLTVMIHFRTDFLYLTSRPTFVPVSVSNEQTQVKEMKQMIPGLAPPGWGVTVSGLIVSHGSRKQQDFVYCLALLSSSSLLV